MRKEKLDFNSAAVIEALEDDPNKTEFSFNVWQQMVAPLQSHIAKLSAL